ncbi:MAG: hypothetical protein QCI38_00495 [Candidatus Thermoplasmatota archaeon]|nr:hypothetical protein [Candidatus Thermoplasmatota archaeon]
MGMDGFVRSLTDRRRAWLVTTVMPLGCLMFDIMLITYEETNMGEFFTTFGFFVMISIMPALVSYWLLGETKGYGGRVFLNSWRWLSSMLPLALIFFGVLFLLHLEGFTMVVGMFSIAVGGLSLHFIKQVNRIFMVAVVAKEEKFRKVKSQRGKKKKTKKLDDIRAHEEEMVKWALEKLEK